MNNQLNMYTIVLNLYLICFSKKMCNEVIKMPARTSLPSWFWMLYYSFLLLTFSVSIITIMKKRNRILSIINLIILITVPVVSFINSIGRIAPNEFQHLIIQLMQGSLWAIYVCAGYLFILIWWILFLKNNNSQD